MSDVVAREVGSPTPMPRRALRLSAQQHARETPPSAGNGIHFATALVETVLADYTEPGGRVLDPFVGYGTTVVVADRMGRVGVGLELQARRAATAARRLPAGSASRVLCRDARALADLDLGTFDLCLTSPPYRTVHDHPEDPLDAYRTHGGDYRSYVREVGAILAAAGGAVRPGGHVVVNAATLRSEGQGSAGFVTPLAADLARELADRFTYLGDTALEWDAPSTFVVADRLLVFRVGP